MPLDGVDVRIGADVSGLQQLDPATQAVIGKLDQLRAATEKVGGSSEHLDKVRHSTESMTQSFHVAPGVVMRFHESLGSLREGLELLGAAYAVHKLTEWVTETAEAAEHAVNMASAIGVTAAAYSRVQAVMRMAGGDAESASRGFLMLQQRMQDAVRDPASKFGDAFSNIGFSYERLKATLDSGDLEAFFRQFAEAYKQLGSTQHADFVELLGVRQLARMVPLLREGAEGYDSAAKKATEFGSALSDEQLHQLEEVAQKIDEIREAFIGLKNAVVIGLADPIKEALGGLTDFLSALAGTSDAMRLRRADEGLRKGGFATTTDIETNPIGEAIRNALKGALSGVSEESLRAAGFHPAPAPGEEGRPGQSRGSADEHDLTPAKPFSAAEHGAVEPGPKLPAGYGEKEARTIYEASLAAAEQSAKYRHAWEELAKIAQARVDLDKMGDKERRDFLAKKLPEVAESAGIDLKSTPSGQVAGAIKAQSGVSGLQQEQEQYNIHTALADLQRTEDEARRQHEFGSVVAIEQAKAEVIKNNAHSTAAERIAAEQHVTAAIQEAKDAQFRLTEESISQAQRIGDLQIKVGQASLKSQVASHTISKEQAAQAEMALTSRIYGEEEKRVEAALQADDLTLQQRAKLNEQLAELYLKDVEAQEQAQAKITAAIEAENKKRLQALTQFADSMGTTLEKVVEGWATGKPMTTADIWKDVMSSGVKSGGSMLSQFAGSKLAPMLGVKVADGDDTSLSSVLSKAIGGALGITKDTPQDKQAAAAEKISKAGDAAQKAADLQKQVADTFGKASDKFAAAVDKIVSGLNATKGGGDAAGKSASDGRADRNSYESAGSISGASTSDQNALALIKKYESRGRYNIGWGDTDLSNAPLDDSGFPQWAGKMGPAGMSHAAGAYQFEPATWRRYAKQAGVSDFSPESQDKVALAAYQKEGYGPWKSNEKLMGAVDRGEQIVKVDTASVSAGVTQGMSGAGAGITADVAAGADQGNQALASATADAASRTDQDTGAVRALDGSVTTLKTSVDQNTQKQGQGTGTGSGGSAVTGATGGGDGGSGGGASGILSGASGLLGAGARVFPGLSQVSSAISGVQSAAKALGQLTSGVDAATTGAKALGTAASVGSTAASTLSSGLTAGSAAASTVSTVMSATGAATTVVQAANVANAAAITTDTAAVTAHAAAEAAGGGGSILGSAGSVIGAAASIIALEGGGIIPSAAAGMIADGKGGQLSVLHPREMVLPAPISGGLQNMIAAGGADGAGATGRGDSSDVHMHFHGPADGPSIQRWWRDNMMANADTLSRIFRQNRLPARI